MSITRLAAAQPGTSHPQTAAFDWIVDWVRRSGDWLVTQSMDERSQHLAAACDHDDLVRRERDCESFERTCRMVPRFH